MALPFDYGDLHGGINLKDKADLLTDNQSPDLMNVQGTTTGAITRRLGCANQGTFTTAIGRLGATNALESAANTPYLIYGEGTKTWSIDLLGVHDISGVLTPTVGQWVNAVAVGGQGPIYGISVTPVQWTGTGNIAAWSNTSGAVTVPPGRYGVYHQNQLFIAGTAVVPVGGAAATDPYSRLYWSAIADPTNWDSASNTGAGFIDLDPGDGQPITGLGVIGPYVLVFKPYKTWVLVDPATATVRKISENVGCGVNDSIASSPQGTFFLSEDRGVCVTDGTKITPIGDLILPDMSGPAQTAAAAYYQAHYYITSPISGYTYDYDTILQSWWRHDLACRGFAVVGQAFPGINPPANGLYAVRFHQAAATTVAQLFVPNLYTDEFATMNWHWYGPWQSPSFYRRRRFPTPYYQKRLTQVRTRGYGNLNFDYAVNYDVSTATNVATNVYGTTGTIPLKSRHFSFGVADTFQMRFSGADANPAALYDYTLYVTDRTDQASS